MRCRRDPRQLAALSSAETLWPSNLFPLGPKNTTVADKLTSNVGSAKADCLLGLTFSLSVARCQSGLMLLKKKKKTNRIHEMMGTLGTI